MTPRGRITADWLGPDQGRPRRASARADIADVPEPAMVMASGVLAGPRRRLSAAFRIDALTQGRALCQRVARGPLPQVRARLSVAVMVGASCPA